MHRFSILQVEDEEADVVLLRQAFKSTGITNRIKVASNGQEAINYLAGREQFADRQLHPIPGLIILDLNLPKKSGVEVLQWIRSHPPFDLIPVIVFSSSALPQDVKTAYRCAANAYVVKPIGMDQLKAFAESLRDFWLVQNQPPSVES